MREEQITVCGNRKSVLKIYDDVKSPKGVMLVIHGMQEHSGRYVGFAKKMNSKGYIIATSDLRGHGDNMVISRPGYSDGNIFEEIVLDQKEFIKFLKREYSKLPLFVLGHSFGSFIAQRLLTESDNLVDKFVLCGSAYSKNIKFTLGGVVAKLTQEFKGRGADAKLVEKLSLKGYGKKFDNGNWLSRDEKVFEDYKNDVLCGLTFPASFYVSMFTSAKNNYKNLAVVDESTPIFIIAGTMDPVGDYTKSVKKLIKVYKHHWLNVYFKFYEGARHELLNETNKEEVIKDIVEFLGADNKKANMR